MQRTTEDLNYLAQESLLGALDKVMARVRKGDYRGAARLAARTVTPLNGMDEAAEWHEQARAKYDDVMRDCGEITASDEDDEK